METFTEINLFVDNLLYQNQREKSLKRYDINTIDTPIIEIVNCFAKLHFFYETIILRPKSAVSKSVHICKGIVLMASRYSKNLYSRDLVIRAGLDR